MQSRLVELEEEIEKLRQQLAALTPDPLPLPARWRLSRYQRAVLALLMKRDVVTYEALRALAPDKPSIDERRLVMVQMYNLRRKFETKIGHRLGLRPVYSLGYSLSDESKAFLREAAQGNTLAA